MGILTQNMPDSVKVAVTIFDTDSNHDAFKNTAELVDNDKRSRSENLKFSETVSVDSQLIGIAVCFGVIFMMMVVVFCYNISKGKKRMRKNSQKNNEKDLSEA